jgi:hypothetical protein
MAIAGALGHLALDFAGGVFARGAILRYAVEIAVG